MGNRRLCSLTPDGEFIKAARISFGLGIPRNIRSLPNGDILIEKEIMSYTEIDKPQECVIELISAELEHKKTIYSHEIWRRRTITTPKRTNIPQPYAFFVYWDVLADGKIIIGFSKKYEIEIHDCDKGKILSFSHSFEPVKVTEEDKKSYFAGLSYSVDGVQQKVPDYIVDNTKFPKFKPAFRSIIADSEGNILVFPHRIKTEENFRYFDAFDSQGNFIASVRVIGDVSFPTISGVCFTGKYIWTPRSGEDELARIIKYRITD